METEPQIKSKHTFKRRKQLEKDFAHVTKEIYKRNLELALTNRTLSLLRTIDTLVLESRDTLEALCEQISEAVTTNSDYAIVGLLVKQQHEAYYGLAGWSASAEITIDKSLVQQIDIKLGSNNLWFGHPQKGSLIHIAHLSDEEIATFLHCKADQINKLRQILPVHSLYAIKLMTRQNVVGIMFFGLSNGSSSLTPNDHKLIERLSEAVGVAIDNKLLFEENKLIVGQLQKTNQKLRELDETKDEFISMASHQLRTPLTSVKGYVSMVLEGDSGKISKMQKQLLSQAFFSSQRMVYLIADLLNVSRLRTGKFVIENKPTQLADVIESELEQLTEAAKSRHLELNYIKPKKFPILMLDETKIRQVIMNFIDNAIYYTPAGGHITVNLVESGESVELTVVDDGLGVPKADQPHLFGKFYRAGNAKKARPDGTGLGLFMAKKVIVTQGGAIVFRSEEGKGSTFGFSFPKAKLAPPKGVKIKPETAEPGKIELK